MQYFLDKVGQFLSSSDNISPNVYFFYKNKNIFHLLSFASIKKCIWLIQTKQDSEIWFKLFVTMICNVSTQWWNGLLKKLHYFWSKVVRGWVGQFLWCQITMFLSAPGIPEVRSMGPSVSHRVALLRLNWCDSGWWRYQINTNW